MHSTASKHNYQSRSDFELKEQRKYLAKKVMNFSPTSSFNYDSATTNSGKEYPAVPYRFQPKKKKKR